MSKTKRSILDVLLTFTLAVATIASLHLTIGSTPAKAAIQASCPHAYCNAPGNCRGATNHGCCFSEAQCTTISCILSPDGCP